MLKFNKIFTLIGFKITWMSCVMGEVYINSWFGFIVGIIFLSFYFLFENKKIEALKLILILSFIGYFFDSVLSNLNIYYIDAHTNFLFLPIWFLVLWPSFSCLLIKCFAFLKNKYLLSFVIGGFFGPLTYYIGITSGLANYSGKISFMLMSLFWACFMLMYSKIINNKIIF